MSSIVNICWRNARMMVIFTMSLLASFEALMLMNGNAILLFVRLWGSMEVLVMCNMGIWLHCRDNTVNLRC